MADPLTIVGDKRYTQKIRLASSLTRLDLVFKWTNHGLFFVSFQTFQYNITILKQVYLAPGFKLTTL